MDDDDLRKLVDEAQAVILDMQSTIHVSDIVRWMDDRAAGVALDEARIARQLDQHPRLVSAAVGGGIWRRGSNRPPEAQADRQIAL
ncbi:hypothetical protein [Mesorhizobium sp.]|uniref:hypothetical protein n=1 Tax=Mesorhizobium sp. TaxID=1871066 RepID=UPI000FE5F423|nr:hypothetical protein [Mesorhizobium sp.]RWP10000.1 MAG: hypothetical protein EOQ97_14895 [Mesorhizobium sp.]